MVWLQHFGQGPPRHPPLTPSPSTPHRDHELAQGSAWEWRCEASPKERKGGGKDAKTADFLRIRSLISTTAF